MENNIESFGQIEQNNPRQTSLSLYSSYIADITQLSARLGPAIATNTHLEDIGFSGGIPAVIYNNTSLIEGLEQNTSISRLSIYECNLTDELSVNFLNSCLRALPSLSELKIDSCEFGQHTHQLLQVCPNLRSLCLDDCEIDEHIHLPKIVETIQEYCHQLEYLSLGQQYANVLIGKEGCEALLPLLQSANCNIDELRIAINNVDNDCTDALATVLRGNEKVERLDLNGNVNAENTNWASYSKLICDTSSINATYYSNHTLNFIEDLDHVYEYLPNDLQSLLGINENVNKKHAAVRKILLHHTHLDMRPFFEWDMKVLPTAVEWFEYASPLLFTQDDTYPRGAGILRHFMLPRKSLTQFINFFMLCQRYLK